MSPFVDGAALIDLAPLAAVLEVSGADATDYLQRMISADVRKIDAEHFIPATVMTAKGKTVAAFDVARSPVGESPFSIWTDPAALGVLADALERLVILEDVTFDRAPRFAPRYSVQGAQASAALAKAFPSLPIRTDSRSVAIANASDFPLVAFRNPRCRAGGWDLWCNEADAAALASALEGDTTAVAPDEAESARIDAGYPRFTVDVDDTRLPPEAGYDDAISYSKGCYVGQEVVARIRTYGHVNWLLRRIRFDGSEVPAAGEAIRIDGAKSDGVVTSAALSPDGSHAVALGYVRYEVAEPGTPAHVGDARHSGRLENLGER